MKTYIILGAVSLFLLGSCNSQSSHKHEAHTQTNETHNHDGHKHESHHHSHDDGHSHEGHNHEGHNHAHDDGHHHSHDGEHNHNHSGDEIVLTQAKAKAAGVVVKHIHPETFHQVIKTSGQVLAARGDESRVVAPIAGTISFRGKVTEGMQVSKGAPLITLSAQNLAEGDPVQKAHVAYDVAKQEYERMSKLAENQIVSQKELARAKEAYEKARIAYEAVAKHHSDNGQSAVAPLNGYVKELFVKEGDYVNVGQPLFSITQNKRLFLRADVSEKHYGSLHNIHSANFCTPYNNKVYRLEALNGRLLAYGKATDENSHYIPVTFEFDNKGEIVPGSFVEIYLLSNPMEQVITLPRTALVEEQGSFFVYRQLDAECYEKQLVTLGADDGERVQILSGVHAHDHIVTEGAYQVKLASATNAIPAHSHEH